MNSKTVNNNTIAESMPNMSGYSANCSCGGHINAEIKRNGFPGLTLEYKCDECSFVFHAIEE